MQKGMCKTVDGLLHSVHCKQVNEQLLPVSSTFFTIYLKKQYIQFISCHNMNNTSEVVTLSVIALNLVAQVKKGWLLK